MKIKKNDIKKVEFTKQPVLESAGNFFKVDFAKQPVVSTSI
jgi:hypothetical protein